MSALDYGWGASFRESLRSLRRGGWGFSAPAWVSRGLFYPPRLFAPGAQTALFLPAPLFPLPGSVFLSSPQPDVRGCRVEAFRPAVRAAGLMRCVVFTAHCPCEFTFRSCGIGRAHCITCEVRSAFPSSIFACNECTNAADFNRSAPPAY